MIYIQYQYLVLLFIIISDYDTLRGKQMFIFDIGPFDRAIE